MSFFGTPCSESARNEKEFGLCDEQNGNKAYSTVHNRELWIAHVDNCELRMVTFTALDQCFHLRKPGTDDQESLCDGMLTFDGGLFLVELKAWRSSGWLSKAEGQLRNSIAHLTAVDDIGAFRQRKAYVCNKRFPNFHHIETARKRMFYDQTGFRIDVNARITIR